MLFGPGSWRHDTDRRPAPPALAVGARLTFDEPARRDDPASPAERSGRRPLTARVERSGRRPLTARVEAVSARSPRLVALRLDRGGDALFAALYALGRLSLSAEPELSLASFLQASQLYRRNPETQIQAPPVTLGAPDPLAIQGNILPTKLSALGFKVKQPP